MKTAYKSAKKILSIILVITLMITAFPTSAFAAIDEPLNGVSGSGWDDFGGLPEDEPDIPPITTTQPDGETSNIGNTDSEDAANNLDELDTAPIEEKSEESTADAVPAATEGTLGE